MGGITSRLPLDKFDCRNLFRRVQNGEKLGKDDNKGVDEGDNIPLMGLSSDVDEPDPTHNPDAWTPMTMAVIDIKQSAQAAKASKSVVFDESKKKKIDETYRPESNSLEANFRKDLTFQNLDSNSFQIDAGNKSSTADVEPAESEQGTNAKRKVTKRVKVKSKVRKGTEGNTGKSKYNKKSSNDRNPNQRGGKRGL